MVPIADLESGEKHRRWEIPATWLAAALSDSEATPRGAPGTVDVVLGLNGQEVVVRGQVTAKVSMPCARTLEPVDVDIDAEVFLMLAPAPVPAAPARRGGRKKKDPGRGKRPLKEEEAALSDEDAAADHYRGEEVVLDPFVREFILLDLPMAPLRSDLRSTETPGIPAPPGGDSRAEALEPAVDPRLAPLAEIARRLRDKE